MKESQYIIATNRVKVSAALTILRDVLGGTPEDVKTYGISDDEVKSICKKLIIIEDRLFSMLDIEGGAL